MFYNADSFITHPINTKKAVLKIIAIRKSKIKNA